MSAREQIQLIANYIMANIPGEPSRDEGAGECAIRLLSKYQAALTIIVHELGVPDGSYPAPVANAYEAARRALEAPVGDRAAPRVWRAEPVAGAGKRRPLSCSKDRGVYNADYSLLSPTYGNERSRTQSSRVVLSAGEIEKMKSGERIPLPLSDEVIEVVEGMLRRIQGHTWSSSIYVKEWKLIEKFIMDRFGGVDERRDAWQRGTQEFFVAFCKHTSNDGSLAARVSKTLVYNGILSVNDLIGKVQREGLRSLVTIRNIGEKSLSLIEELVKSLEAETGGCA